jgi:NADH-quinone oxidoreductase subunit H
VSDSSVQLIAGVIKVLFIIALVVLMFAPVLTLAERKISSWMQDRIGPNRAHFFKVGGKPFVAGGLFHTMADALKMFAKEWTTPDAADKLLFNLAPVVAVFPALLMFAVMPFGPPIVIGGHTISLQIANVNVGLLFIFALGSLGVYGAALAGWASNNKLALLGALRASAQSISYEVTFGLTLVGLMMLFGTVQVDHMVTAQGGLLWGWLPKWGIFMQPLGFAMFFTAALAENKRIPFDLPEGESEIVGYFVEYSSMGFGLFMTGEFIEMVVIAFMSVTLFLGGYLLPWLTNEELVSFIERGVSHEPATWLAALIGFSVFFVKVVVLLFLQFVVRWALPRFRYDQLMRLGWKYLLPLSLANLMVTGAAILIDPTDGLVGAIGLGVLGVFVMSLFYSGTPADAEAKPAHDAGHAAAH